jgi:hypothetical protein
MLTRGNVVFNGSSTPKYIREMLAAVSEAACTKKDNLNPTRKKTREATSKRS